MSNRPLNLLPLAQARRLGDFFRESAYSLENVHKLFGRNDFAMKEAGNTPVLLFKTEEPTLLNALVRLFWIGAPEDSTAIASLIPHWVIELSLASNLLRTEGKQFVAEMMVFPVDDVPIVADRPSRYEAGLGDVVLWPNPTTRLLSRFTIRRPFQRVLDIGTGTGVLAISEASHCEKVFATDVNERALNVAAFNTRLNGRENIECLLGSGFEPVPAGEFDLITCNPPFFITPSRHYVFSDSPMELDGFCRQLVQEGSQRLTENGYFQLVCEWPEIKGQAWKERIAEWFTDSGCDVWVVKTMTRDAGKYAVERVQETSWSAPGRSAQRCQEYLDYYKEKKIEAIHNGVVAMRRRSGQNWMSLEESSATPQVPFGDVVLNGFEARDFLASNPSPSQWLEMKPVLSAGVQMEQVMEYKKPGWAPASITLITTSAYPFNLSLQPLVAEFLGRCDGVRTLGELAGAVAAKVNAPREQVERECIDIMRKLIKQGCAMPS